MVRTRYITATWMNAVGSGYSGEPFFQKSQRFRWEIPIENGKESYLPAGSHALHTGGPAKIFRNPAENLRRINMASSLLLFFLARSYISEIVLVTHSMRTLFSGSDHSPSSSGAAWSTRVILFFFGKHLLGFFHWERPSNSCLLHTAYPCPHKASSTGHPAAIGGEVNP